jgi:hypothetical protein
MNNTQNYDLAWNFVRYKNWVSHYNMKSKTECCSEHDAQEN